MGFCEVGARALKRNLQTTNSGCWVEGSATDGKPWAVALSGQASHQLTGMAAADCLLRVAADRGDLTPGSLVEALPLPWSRGLPA